MAQFTTQSIRTPQPTREDFAQAFGNNQRLIRFFEALTVDIRSTLPDAVVTTSNGLNAPFLLSAASTLVPNGSVLVVGTGLTRTAPGPAQFGVALAVPVTVANGGTGASNATAARGNLGAAASGVNSDITSLVGLTTPLPVNEGGTGATTASVALANLGGVTSAQAAAAAPVQSVFTRTGAVVAATGDYTAAQITNGGDTTKPLSQFAATTSTQLRGVLTDPTGTAGAVFATGPTLNQPVINGLTSGAQPGAGAIGETLTANTSGTSMTNATAVTVASRSFTAGVWDVSGVFQSAPAGTTTSSFIATGISTANNTFQAIVSGVSNGQYLWCAAPAGQAMVLEAPVTRLAFSAPTTVYLIAQMNFATSTMSGNGFIIGRRVA